MRPWVWVVPEESGGIRTYSEALWDALKMRAPEGSRIFFHDRLDEIVSSSPALIHIQHEYGCWGGKTPGFYRFSGWLKEAKRALPETRFVATAHNVIPMNYRYPVVGKGWQIPLRLTANLIAMPALARWWNASWRDLDAVIVHSALQLGLIQKSGCPRALEIPHFVPEALVSPIADGKRVLVFGYFSPDKGQYIAIRAMKNLPGDVELLLAGAARTAGDRAYLAECESLIQELGLSARVKITGYVPKEEMDRIYDQAALVLAPFRYTTGSGSLAHALARGKAILASDLPLNREIVERVPGALAFFKSEDVRDCAHEIERLLASKEERENLSHGAREYAFKYSVEKTVQAHIRLYEELGAVR